MGFGGGNTGSFVLPDHKHSSDAQDGGVLDADQTEVDLSTLDDYTGVMTTKGDIMAYDTAKKRLPVGSNGQILKVDSSEALGVKWSDGGVQTQKDTLAINYTTNSTSWQDTGLALTLPTRSGKALVNSNLTLYCPTATAEGFVRILKGTSEVLDVQHFEIDTSNERMIANLSGVCDMDGEGLKVQLKSNNGAETVGIDYIANEAIPKLETFEVSS